MFVYLDNSATTRPCAPAVAALREAAEEKWFNPSSLYEQGMAAEKAIEDARLVCKKAVNATQHRLIFTSGGTEADNLAILGHLRLQKKPGRVLMLSVEHPAVLQCAKEVEKLGHRVEEIPVDVSGVLDVEKLRTMMGEDVLLITVMQVNNEVGAIQPIDEVVRLRNELRPKAAIHVDGVQGYLRVPFNFDKSGVQSYAFSGHKIHAVKGIGGLIVRKYHRLQPLLEGGGQEAGERSGTENTPGIAALKAAVTAYPPDGAEKMQDLKTHLWREISRLIPQAVLNGPDLDSDAAAPHILSVSLPPVRSQTMLFALEKDGVLVSNGSACASRKQKISGVLSAMGMDHLRADCTLRMSLSHDLTMEQMEYAAASMAKHYELLKIFVRR